MLLIHRCMQWGGLHIIFIPFLAQIWTGSVRVMIRLCLMAGVLRLVLEQVSRQVVPSW